MIKEWLNQKEIPTPKTKMEKYQIDNNILGTYTKKTYHKPSKQLFLNRRPLS